MIGEKFGTPRNTPNFTAWWVQTEGGRVELDEYPYHPNVGKHGMVATPRICFLRMRAKEKRAMDGQVVRRVPWAKPT